MGLQEDLGDPKREKERSELHVNTRWDIGWAVGFGAIGHGGAVSLAVVPNTFTS